MCDSHAFPLCIADVIYVALLISEFENSSNPVSLLSHQAEKSVIDVLETMEQKLEESLEAVTSSADGILTSNYWFYL